MTVTNASSRLQTPLAGVPEAFDSTRDRAVFCRPGHLAGVELYRAHIVDHAFRPHCHEAFGVGAIESGIERFRYRGSDHLAGPGSLVLMEDDQLHTGQAETSQGWQYRMIYIERDVFARVTGLADMRFEAATVDAPSAGARATRLLDRLWLCNEDGLAFDCALAEYLRQFVVPYIRCATAGDADTDHKPAWTRTVTEFVEASLHRTITLDQLAAVARLSPFHFLRTFKRVFRFTPADYIQARRVYRAKQLLAQSVSPAQAAADCGLADQAHLTRLLKRMFGVTPAAYQQQLGTRPQARQ